MIAFLDSSALMSIARYPSTEKLAEMKGYLEAVGVWIYTGEVVIDECVNKLQERYMEEKDKYLRTGAELEKLIGQNFLFGELALSDDSYLHRYRDELVRFFGEETSSILPYPNVPHSAIAKLAMEGRKPYNKGHKDGYRDSLVWFTFVNLVEKFSDRNIMFVTANHTDFSASKTQKDQFHPDLLRLLVELNVDTHRITIKDSLQIVLDTMVDNLKVDIEDDLAVVRPRADFDSDRLMHQIASILDSHAPAHDFPTQDLLGAPMSIFESIEFSDLSPTSIKLVEFEILPIGAIRLVLDVQTRGTVIFEVHSDDLPANLSSIHCDDFDMCYGTHDFQLPLHLSLIMDKDKWVTSAAAKWQFHRDFEVVLEY